MAITDNKSKNPIRGERGIIGGEKGYSLNPKDYRYIVAIDPDVDKSGVAFLDTKTHRLELSSLTFPLLLDFISYCVKKKNNISVCVLIEAGWLRKSNWHLSYRDSKHSAAAKGNAAGRNHEVGRKIAEICAHKNIAYELIEPLQLKVGGSYIWKGKDGKITHKELAAFTGIIGRTNQEERDAALIAWTWAGLSMRRVREVIYTPKRDKSEA